LARLPKKPTGTPPRKSASIASVEWKGWPWRRSPKTV
jgi:hypothetical protein